MTDARLSELEQESPLAVRLAELASLAVRVDAGLLRRLRRDLLPEADVAVELELWFSTLVEARSENGFQMAPDVVALLRRRLASEPGRPPVSRVRAVLAEAHAQVSPAIRLEEKVNGLAVELGTAARPLIADALRPALRALTAGGPEAAQTARWVFHAVPRLHPLVLATPIARTLVLAASLLLRTRPRSIGGALEPTQSIAELGWALPPLDLLGEPESLGVELVPGGLQFCAPDGASGRIQLPPTEPRVVEIEWALEVIVETTRGWDRRRVLSEAAAGVLVALAGDPDEVTITTLSGDRYQLSRQTRGADTAATSATRYVPPSPRLLAACLQIEPLGMPTPLGVAVAVGPALLLTPTAVLREFPVVGVHDSATQLAWRPWSARESDEGHEDELARLVPIHGEIFDVALQASEWASEDDGLEGSVAGFVEDRPRWFHVVVQPRDERWSVRRGVLWHPPQLSARELRAAFVGSPFVVDDRLAGVVLSLTPPSPPAEYATIEVTSPGYLRSVRVRAGLSASSSGLDRESVDEVEGDQAARQRKLELVARLIALLAGIRNARTRRAQTASLGQRKMLLIARLVRVLNGVAEERGFQDRQVAVLKEISDRLSAFDGSTQARDA
ncbi:MAG TPA: hypothetical protein VN811_11755 [Thermoanaerobaculia bacterium]|nr:hypothetical protein [Thermoanaerobaculia bacterium]